MSKDDGQDNPARRLKTISGVCFAKGGFISCPACGSPSMSYCALTKDVREHGPMLFDHAFRCRGCSGIYALRLCIDIESVSLCWVGEKVPHGRVVDIIRRAKVGPDFVDISHLGYLDKPLFRLLAGKLAEMGGKWSLQRHCFVFDTDPLLFITAYLENVDAEG